MERKEGALAAIIRFENVGGIIVLNPKNWTFFY